jgi:hypothetical protein
MLSRSGMVEQVAGNQQTNPVNSFKMRANLNVADQQQRLLTCPAFSFYSQFSLAGEMVTDIY